jgi:hypothetical protein
MVLQEVETRLDDKTIIRLIEYAKKRFPGVHSSYDDLIRSLLTEAGF